MLYIDMIDRKISGCCKAGEAKKYGLIAASMRKEE